LTLGRYSAACLITGSLLYLPFEFLIYLSLCNKGLGEAIGQPLLIETSFLCSMESYPVEEFSMARPYWSGQITISLVSFSVKLFVATEAKGEIHFHQISRATGERVKYQKVTASEQQAADHVEDDAAPLGNDEIVKGYEYRKGEYVTLEPNELAELRVPSKHTMEVSQFVDEAEIDPEYFEKSYFVVPEDDSQTAAFGVVRRALKDTQKIALSKIAFGGREHIVAIAPTPDDSLGGMMAYTIRYATELRDAKEYFGEIKHVEVDEESLDLAKQLIKRKTAKFDPTRFVDGYEKAVKELVQAKIDHVPIPKDKGPAKPRGRVISLMDALRKSIGENNGTPKKKPAARRGTPPQKGIALVKGAGAKGKSGKSTKRRSA
jgi:DNA end-binding protein Ku